MGFLEILVLLYAITSLAAMVYVVMIVLKSHSVIKGLDDKFESKFKNDDKKDDKNVSDNRVRMEINIDKPKDSNQGKEITDEILKALDRHSKKRY